MKTLGSLGHLLSYLLIRFIFFPIWLLPYAWIHWIGNQIGAIGFYFGGKYRKRVMNNLAIARDLHLTEEEMIRIGREVFQNLAITCLEFFRIGGDWKRWNNLVRWKNPEGVLEQIREGKGAVGLVSHQANWEICLLEVTRRVPVVAIGRPIKNRFLYNWILSMRQMFGAVIVPPKAALRAGMKALKEGKFMGIVGDQALRESGYTYPLFGVRACTGTAPALYAYRTGTPIFVFTIERKNRGYEMVCSEPIWPDRSRPLREEVSRMMDEAMKLMEEGIRQNPGQWLWFHKRWKQRGTELLPRRFRYDFLLIIMPRNVTLFQQRLSALEGVKQLYPNGFITLMLPKGAEGEEDIVHYATEGVLHYATDEEKLVRDWRYQMVLDFTDDPSVKGYYLKLGAFEVLDSEALLKQARKNQHDVDEKSWSEIVVKAFG